MDGEVFVLSDMTIETHDLPTGRVIGFNGVTEWALDSVEQDQALWLPAEDQLRSLLGGLFRRLEAHDASFTVTVALPGGERTHRAPLAEQAYGEALLAVLESVTGPTAAK
jgi:hypothetical protein